MGAQRTDAGGAENEDLEGLPTLTEGESVANVTQNQGDKIAKRAAIWNRNLRSKNSAFLLNIIGSINVCIHNTN